MEKCQSGRMGLTRNQLCRKRYRGFESLLLRHWAQPDQTIRAAKRDENAVRRKERTRLERGHPQDARAAIRHSRTNPSFSAIGRSNHDCLETQLSITLELIPALLNWAYNPSHGERPVKSAADPGIRIRGQQIQPASAHHAIATRPLSFSAASVPDRACHHDTV